MNRCRAVWILLVIAVFNSSASAGDFMDIRLSWVLAENNFLVEPGETSVNSPGIGIGANENNTLFFDNYDTKYTGFETFGHLVLYKKMPAFFENFNAEAALVLRIGAQYLDDEGSYIRMTYDFSDGFTDDENIELTLFPLSGDRFRLGYSYTLSWAADDIFPLRATFVPAVKLQLNIGWGYCFVGLKTAQLRETLGDTSQTELVTNYGTMAGLGVDIEGFVVEVNGGYFTRGTFEHEGVRGRGLYLSGISYQVGYHQGTEIGASIDFELYKNDPYMETLFFLPEEYDGGLSFVIKHEGTFLTHNLLDPDERGQMSQQLAYAFDVNFSLKYGYFRIHLDAIIRSLSFLLHEVPSFTPFQNYPDGVETSPEYWAAVGVDYHFPSTRLTPGIKFGFKQPATYTTQNLSVGGVSFAGGRTIVVNSRQSRSILPEGEGALIVWSVKASLKWDYAEMLSLVAEIYYAYDDNHTRYESDFWGLNIMSRFVDPNVLGLNLMAQARF
ncbi:MAG: hypothetical protein JRJ87_17340 [Deltaproteobacteria bacterium]|nr:hypothetical protein [Deltaproteobacteria bacterium]